MGVMTPAEAFRDQVLQVINVRHEIFTDVDGFRYFWPEGYNGGCFSAAALRVIADELDRMNKPHQDEIDKYFADLPDILL